MVDIYHKPGNGRLHFQKVPSPLRYGAWATAGAHYLTAKDSWFQVDFGSWRKVTIIATQGRQDALQWVTKYRVSYSYDGIFFKDYMEGGYRKVLKSQIKVKITLLKNKFVVQSIVVPLCVAGWGWGRGGGEVWWSWGELSDAGGGSTLPVTTCWCFFKTYRKLNFLIFFDCRYKTDLIFRSGFQCNI